MTATMRLTSFTDYGLRALMLLAGEPTRRFTTSEIAERFGISVHHLTKIVRELAAAGIVETRRGAGGGFRLARRADRLTLGEIVRVLEARSALVECFQPGGGSCLLMPGCSLRRRLQAARAAFLAELDASTLADCAVPATAMPAVEPA